MKKSILVIIAIFAIGMSANAQSLNGKWKTSGGTGIDIRYGSYGTIYSFSSTAESFKKAGLIKKGDIILKDIHQNSDGSWNCKMKLTYKKNGVPTALPWSDTAVITMHDNGRYIKVHYTLEYKGNYIDNKVRYYRDN